MTKHAIKTKKVRVTIYLMHPLLERGLPIWDYTLFKNAYNSSGQTARNRIIDRIYRQTDINRTRQSDKVV